MRQGEDNVPPTGRRLLPKGYMARLQNDISPWCLYGYFSCRSYVGLMCNLRDEIDRGAILRIPFVIGSDENQLATMARDANNLEGGGSGEGNEGGSLQEFSQPQRRLLVRIGFNAMIQALQNIHCTTS